MASKDKFKILRSILSALGLSAEAIDDIIDRILDFLTDGDAESESKPEYPYHIRDNFLSAAEHSFYLVLQHIVADKALICPKVSLGDLFYVKSSDASKFRIYTNKIDRKHVDFLLCDPKTLQPVVGIELDDKSHQRKDRQKRDQFIEAVYTAAKLPLVRFPVRRSYATSELDSALHPYLNPGETAAPSQPVVKEPQSTYSPLCPKCNSEMVLRTATRGPNQGEKFWGCPNYPKCRGIRNYDG